MTPTDLIMVSSAIALLLLITALLLATVRVMLGPSLADRVLALDMLIAITIGFIAVVAIRTGYDLYVDIALALGLVGFLATVAFARFIASGAEGPPNAPLPKLEAPVRRLRSKSAADPQPAKRKLTKSKGRRP